MRKFSVFISTILFLFLANSVSAEVRIENTFGFGSIKSLGEGTSRLTMPLFSVAAALVTLYFVFAAFDYAKAGADKEAVAKAQKKITHSIIGFVLLIFAFFVIQFILSSLLEVKDIELIK